ncbi:DEAD/DEAH box helicase family protein [Pseudoalteromonas sp.]|uniref:DEAD/DEAH box helicase family protein n=1 Tax=Pseudoalteromonas sp. TaxID=53249 RepID=UPI00356845DA
MFKLRDYQQRAHDVTIEHCKLSSDPAIIDCTVGGGKTVLIGSVIQHVTNKGGRVLVLARQGELIKQGAETAQAMGLRVSIFSASLNQKSTYYPVVFGTEGTVGRSLKTVFKNIKFDILLIDEAHHVDHLDCISDKPETQYGMIINHFKALNNNIRIIGYTGSPYRGSTEIIGDFWKNKLTEISTYELINKGFLVPPIFGFGDEAHQYEGLNQFSVKGGEGAGDFTTKELAAMGRAVCKEQTKTQEIMAEVIERTKDKLGVLITCASKKHCEQVAECLPDGSWGIITDSTSTKERIRILDGAKDGSIKYVLQIGCLSTGVDVSQWQCCVILRNIGSLSLIIQLIGRVLRTLKPHEIDAGLVKNNALVLDYSSTLEQMGDIYCDPLLEQATLSRAKPSDVTQDCPLCSTINTEFAVRCIGHDDTSEDGRCEHYFMFNECKACGAHNAPTAKTCRKCEAVLIDPNAALTNKAYTDADYKEVERMVLTESTGGKLRVAYYLKSMISKMGIEEQEVAVEWLDPFFNTQFHKAKWRQFVEEHVSSNQWKRAIRSCTSIGDIIQNQAAIEVPEAITHRVNDKGFSVINRKKFKRVEQ